MRSVRNASEQREHNTQGREGLQAAAGAEAGRLPADDLPADLLALRGQVRVTEEEAPFAVDRGERVPSRWCQGKEARFTAFRDSGEAEERKRGGGPRSGGVAAGGELRDGSHAEIPLQAHLESVGGRAALVR